jgi:hypothetical protein
MGLSKATKVWLDGVAEGNDHAALCACEVFAALESGDGVVSAKARAWLGTQLHQKRYPMVRNWAGETIGELNMLRELDKIRSNA